jgi:multiple sugar transport system permease protein
LDGSAFLLPGWLVLIPVVGVPLIVAVYTSLTNESLLATEPARFVGLANFQREVLSGRFWSSLAVTVTVMICSLIVQVPIGFALAHALVKPFRGRSALRTALTIPMLLTPIAVGLMWKFLADPDFGIIRWAASLADQSGRPNVLGNPISALALVVVVNSWINIPFVTLMLLAGLVGIPDDLYEAAAIDGADRRRTLRYITIPMLLPVLAVTCALRAAADYRMFDIVYTVTKGGPGDATRNLSMLVYQQGLLYFQIGRASAIAVAMALIALPSYWFFVRMVRS